LQVEYAQKAVDKTGLNVGISCQDGVVIGEKIVADKLLIPASYNRIYSISKYAGLSVCGVLTDGRQIVSRGREERISIFKK